MRKFCVFPIFVFLLLGSFVYAQKLNEGTFKAEVWREFAAEDGSFKILFPMPPQSNSPLDLPVSKYYTSTVSPTEKYLLEFKDYPAPVLDETEALVRLEPYIPSPPIPENLPMPTIPSAKSSSPKPDPWNPKKLFKVVRTQNNFGVEFTIDSEKENTTNTIRIFIARQREFTLRVTTPLLVKLPLAQRQSYQRKIDAFFNSFKIGSIPPAKYTPIPYLPEDFGSVLRGNEYLNKYFGFKINLPPDWKVERMHRGNTNLTKESKCEKSFSNCWYDKNNPTLISVIKESKPMTSESVGFLIETHRPNFPDDSLDEFVEQQKFKAQDDDEKPEPKVQTVRINGQKFLMFEVEKPERIYFKSDDDPLLKERMYFINRNRVFLIFSLKYRDKVDERLLEESLKTLAFLN
jgi:hypothetical protein